MNSEMSKPRFSNEFSSDLSNSDNYSYPFTRKKPIERFQFVGRFTGCVRPDVPLPKAGSWHIDIEQATLQDIKLETADNGFDTIQESDEDAGASDDTAVEEATIATQNPSTATLLSEPLNLCSKGTENDISEELSNSKLKSKQIKNPISNTQISYSKQSTDDSFINMTSSSKLEQQSSYSCTVPAYQGVNISDMLKNKNSSVRKQTPLTDSKCQGLRPELCVVNDRARRNIFKADKENIPNFNKSVQIVNKSDDEGYKENKNWEISKKNVEFGLTPMKKENNVVRNDENDGRNVKFQSNEQLYVAPSRSLQADNDNFVVPRPPSGIHTKLSKSTVELIIKGKTYTVLKSLGKGGSSEVFLVSQVSTGELLAVKQVKLTELDETTKNEYLDEIRHLERMQNSEHVIKLYDYEHVEQQKMLFVVMERGDTDLSTYLKQYRTSLIPEAIIYFWVEMLLAVKNMHDNNIIHRDLKPANFLLVKGKLKLIDFGIASSIQSDQTSVLKDNRTGTCNYMSPEAFMDLGVGNQTIVKIGRKSDVWSLGCILYKFLYGKTPFQEIRNVWAKFQAMSNPKHIIGFPALPGIPAMLIESCKKCLIHDVYKRASIQQLLEMRQNYLNQTC